MKMIHRSAKSLENATRDAFTYDALEIQPHYFRISVQASLSYLLTHSDISYSRMWYEFLSLILQLVLGLSFLKVVQ